MSIDDIPEVVRKLRTSFASGRSRSLAWRLRQLDGIKRFVHDRERELGDALYADLGRPAVESFTAELAFVRGDADYIAKRLAKWMKPERVGTPLPVQPGKSYVHKDSLGVVLVIGPWNYPLQLMLSPLVGALAAGNAVLLKPSEIAKETSRVVANLLPNYVDNDFVQVVEGGIPETTALLEERFDHIFYTGNGAVGRIVMTAAAKHLTPVTLELGGKSPCVVDSSANLDVAAKRIVWSKFFNAGQTCVAPDYILVERDSHDALVARLKATIRAYFGDDPKTSPDFGRIINARHLQRLAGLLGSGDVVTGGEVDERDRYLAPTVLINVAPDSPVMADEIFGPILPVLSVDSIDDAIRFINARPKPLALYVFSGNVRAQDRILENTSSGGAVVNHALMHLAVPGLPFGGVGESGMGAYHGKASFETFSHRRAVLRKTTSIDPDLLYPPYTESKERWVRRLV